MSWFIGSTLMNLDQLDETQKPLMHAILPKMGYSSKWFQLHAGISSPVLECPSLEIPYLEAGWFRTLRKFLCFINAEIHIDNIRVPQTLREKDHALMEPFMDTHHFSDKDMSRLNLCRIYLRVEFLSEICNPEGDNILPEVWQGR